MPYSCIHFGEKKAPLDAEAFCLCGEIWIIASFLRSLASRESGLS